jgi:N-hydroxyarylamine O-acetyltransferase
MEVGAYLERIGYHGPHDPTEETLAGLQRAHLLSVPFDALDCHLGNPVTIEPADAYRKVVGARRGGFCFELNGLFAWLLEELGFAVTRLAARPVIGADGALAPPAAHLALLVELGGRRLADVGFGVPFALEPLDVDDRGEQVRAGRAFRVYEDPGGLVAEATGLETLPRAYRFTLDPAPPGPFAASCAASTDPESMFATRAPVQQLFADGWVIVTRQAVSGRRGGEPIDRPIAGEDDWREQLERHFGLVVEGSDVRGI